MKDDSNEPSEQNDEKHFIAILRASLKVDRPISRIEISD